MPRRNDAARVGELRWSEASALGSAGTSEGDAGDESSRVESEMLESRRREMKPVRPRMRVGGLP